MIYNVISSGLKPVERHMYIFLYKTDNAALTRLLMIIIFIFPYNTLHPLQNNHKKQTRHCTRYSEYCISHLESMTVLVRLHQAHWQRSSHWKLG